MKHSSFFFIAVALLVFILPKGACAQNVSFQGNVKATVSTIAWEPFRSADLSLGARFGNKNYLGLGSGYHYYRHSITKSDGPTEHVDKYFAPLYLDYIHYFPFGKARRNSYFLGAEAGGAMKLKSAENENSIGYHAVFKTGFDFGITDKLGAFISLDVVAGNVTGIGAVSAGLRF